MNFTRLAASNAVANTVTRVALLAIIVPPLAVFLFEAVAGLSTPSEAGAGAPFSLALLVRSVSMAGLAAVTATVVGTTLGLVAGRLGFWGSRIVLFALVMPLAAPAAIHAYVWRNMALSAGLLGDLFVEGGSWAVNFAGAVGSLVSAFWAIPALAAFAVAAGPGKRYELEARPFAAPGTAARRILVPSLLPGAAVSAGVVFVLAFSDYIVASLWQIDTYPVRILSIYSSFFQPRVAAAASLVPAAVTLVVCAGLFIAAGKALTRFDVERAVVERDILWRPGRMLRALALSAVAALAGTPVIASAYWTWANWPGLGGLTTIAEDFLFTLIVAAVAAATGACVAAFAAGAHWVRGRRWGYAMAALSLMVFLLPAAGVGLAVKQIAQWQVVPREFGGTPAALVYALAGRFLAVPLVLTMIAMARIDRRYAYLTRVSGAGGLRAAAAVGVPLAFPAAAAGAVIAMVLGVAELPIAMLVAAPGRPPISVELFNLMHYARQGEAFAASLAMMAGASAAIFAIFALTRKSWKQYMPIH